MGEQKRATNHVRQWANSFKCMDVIRQDEALFGFKYDVVWKMREDVYSSFPWQLSEEDYKGRVLTKKCNKWGGMNDKVAILDRKYAKTFLTAPLLDYFLYYQEVKKAVGLAWYESKPITN